MGKLFASLLICVISSMTIYSQTFEKIKLGEPLVWLNFEIKNEDSNIYYNKEQKLDFSKIRKGLQFHISIQSNNREIIEQLTKIVESIELSN